MSHDAIMLRQLYSSFVILAVALLIVAGAGWTRHAGYWAPGGIVWLAANVCHSAATQLADISPDRTIRDAALAYRFPYWSYRVTAIVSFGMLLVTAIVSWRLGR